MKSRISPDELLISKSLFVISFVSSCKLHRNRIAETLANFSGKVFSALNDFIPDLFIQVVQIAVTDIIFKQSVDQACVKVITGSNGADGFQRLYRIFFADQVGTQRYFVATGGADKTGTVELYLIFISCLRPAYYTCRGSPPKNRAQYLHIPDSR